MPKDLNSVLGMSKLNQLLIKQGFDEKLMNKVLHQNWIDLIKCILK